MKHKYFLLPAVLILALAIGGAAASAAGLPKAVPTAVLSETESADLSFQREEEKLARDVYLSMYSFWGTAIYSNIAASEQKHMDVMKKMLDKYNLPDPALPDFGAFTDAGLQEKFDNLVEAGSRSYAGGLYVGATIEEIDMVDLQDAIESTKHVDLLTTYQNLLEGSKNHLRAFVKLLSAAGVEYKPQFISQEYYDAIIGL